MEVRREGARVKPRSGLLNLVMGGEEAEGAQQVEEVVRVDLD